MGPYGNQEDMYKTFYWTNIVQFWDLNWAEAGQMGDLIYKVRPRC